MNPGLKQRLYHTFYLLNRFENKVKILVATMLLLVMVQKVQAQKNDTIFLLNGDRITGEIKKFEAGLLFVGTDAMLTVSMPYDRINTIYSAKFYELITNSGIRYFGTIAKSENIASILLVIGRDSIQKQMWDIVSIAKIKSSFIDRLDGSISLGLSYTKASDILQYSTNIQVTHRVENYATRIALSSIYTRNSDNTATNNNDFGLSLTRFLPNKWFLIVNEKYQHNTELDLAYRIQTSLGPGYDFVRNNKIRFYGIVGVSQNIEQTIETAVKSTNLEGIGSLQFHWVQYRHPKIDVTSGLNYYPSLTIDNRFRLEYNLTAKYELINDLFFSIDFYDKLDSRNISDNKANNDFGIVTSIGYTF